jgi:uncharacterized cupredoxin-like copper-binding protein
MAVYFVIGGTVVAWALILSFGGMARVKDFPDKRGGRFLLLVSLTLAAGAFTALLATTKKEHPREEAQAKAAEKTKEEQAATPGAAGGTVAVSESEYKIVLAGGTTLKAGNSTFDVKNAGKIQHDLAVEGPGGEKKTPLIDAGKASALQVDLRPGKYKLYCTVPGHEQLGMKAEVTVR